MELAGRSIVLTGVGREGQVGEAVAIAFAERGARVFLVDHSEPNVRARAEALVTRGLRAASLAADLTDPAAATAVADRVREATSGRVHGVVHLAGGFASSGPIAESDPAVWHRQLAMNATTAYMTARAFVPLLRNVKGSLVFFASEAVLPGAKAANLAAYAASKSAVVALMQVIAQEERAHGVRANAVAPTTIRTSDNVAAMGAETPMVTREAVADVVLWLCSDASRAVSGQLVPVR
ncbi:MAG TPA: SDR family oxidoreductase [Gemmatimonadaceae bacterium]|nr:SDR family oxidoreductase [Gemmatimonadaceae bacterium]